MTDKKPPPEIMFMMIGPDDMSTYARASQTPYGPDANRVRLEWLLGKMKSVQNTEEKKDVYIPKAGEVGDFLTVNLWEYNPYQFEDNTYGWMSPGGIPSVFLAAADDSDVRVNTWDVLTHFFGIDQDNLFDAIRKCAKIEPSPDTVPVPPPTREPKTVKFNAGQVREYLKSLRYRAYGCDINNSDERPCQNYGIPNRGRTFLIPRDDEAFLPDDEFDSIAKAEAEGSTELLNKNIREFLGVKTEALNAKDYNQGFEDGRKDVNEIKLNWDVFCEIAELKPMSIVGTPGNEDTFEYTVIKGEDPFTITSDKGINPDIERMRRIIEKINYIWFEAGVQKGINRGAPEPPTRIPPGPVRSGDGKEEIPMNAQLFRYLVRFFGETSLVIQYLGSYIEIYKMTPGSEPPEGKRIIRLGRTGKMKLSRWQKIQEPFLKIYGCDLSEAHETYTHPEIDAVEGSKPNV